MRILYFIFDKNLNDTDLTNSNRVIVSLEYFSLLLLIIDLYWTYYIFFYVAGAVVTANSDQIFLGIIAFSEIWVYSITLNILICYRRNKWDNSRDPIYLLLFFLRLDQPLLNGLQIIADPIYIALNVGILHENKRNHETVRIYYL